MEEMKYKEFMELVAGRYSCRNYDSRPVGRELLTQLLEAARLAPSACNKQPWTFFVLDTPELLAGAADCYGRDWLKTAPAVIVAVGHHPEAWHRQADGKDHTDVDLAIAVEHICLASTTLGLGTCWICNFDAPRCAALLHLPDGQEPIAMIPVGYPAEGTKEPEKRRKSLDEIVKWGVL